MIAVIPNNLRQFRTRCMENSVRRIRGKCYWNDIEIKPIVRDEDVRGVYFKFVIKAYNSGANLERCYRLTHLANLRIR